MGVNSCACVNPAPVYRTTPLGMIGGCGLGWSAPGSVARDLSVVLGKSVAHDDLNEPVDVRFVPDGHGEPGVELQ